MNHLCRVMACAGLLTVAAAPDDAAAATVTAGWGGEPQDVARRALEAGEVVDLGRILDKVRRVYDCEVLEAELENGGRFAHPVPWVYAVKILTRDGAVLQLHIDAKTMEIIQIHGSGTPPGEGPGDDTPGLR